ncbi:MAG: helix-turn-helix transcriptional regulator, partial [Erysipelotrichaceae bacterium]|nr:helix-turn-helix transcriptional regulator [Erysipelotrichaceae bacterium]
GYLSYLFNSQVHMKISDYISKEKIELSKSLLRSTNNSIVDIANYLSFSSQSHFNNTFKKLTGMTPLAYRRSA